MSKAMFKRLGYPDFTPTSRSVQLVDALIRCPEGIVESLLVFVQGSCIFEDFMVLDKQDDAEMPLILGRPFLSDARGRINVENGTIHFCWEEELDVLILTNRRAMLFSARKR
jgi:hypothetical protein